jgi:CHAT domain-containing protein
MGKIRFQVLFILLAVVLAAAVQPVFARDEKRLEELGKKLNALSEKMKTLPPGERGPIIQEILETTAEFQKAATGGDQATEVEKAALKDLQSMAEFLTMIGKGQISDLIDHYLKDLDTAEVPKEKLSSFQSAAVYLALSAHDTRRAMTVAQAGIDRCDHFLQKGEKDLMMPGDLGIFFLKLQIMRAKALALALADKMEEARATAEEMTGLAWESFTSPVTKHLWLDPTHWGFVTNFQQSVFPILDAVERVHGPEEVEKNWLPWAKSVLASQAFIMSAFQPADDSHKTILANYGNMFLQGQAQILLAAGRASEALALIDTYPFEKKDLKFEPYVIYPLLIRGKALAQTGNLARALSEFAAVEKAFEYYESKPSMGGGMMITFSRWWPMMMTGRILEQQGKAAEAIAAFQKARDQLRKLYESLKSTSARREYIRESDKVYSRLIRLHLEQNQVKEALDTIEESQSKTMLDLFEDVFNGSRKHWPDDLKERRNKIHEQLERLDQAPVEPPASNGNGKTRSAPAAPEATRALSRKLLQEMAQIENEAEKRVGVGTQAAAQKWRASFQGKNLYGETLTRQPDALSILFLIKEDPCFAIVTGAGKSEAVRLEAGAEKIRLAANRFRKALVAGKTGWEKPARDLYEILFKPIEAKIAATDRLMIFPEGILWYIPFGALLDAGGKPLITRFRLGIGSGVGLIADTLKSATVKPSSPGKNRLLIVANPDGTLPHAAAEGRDIASRTAATTAWEAVIWEGRDALKSRFAGQAESGDYFGLHFATHGVLDDLNPLASFLVFAGGAEKGQFRVSDITHLNLTGKKVAVLSACNTALGTVSGGNEVVGLQSAFHEAGVPAVIASLWEVSDESTARLMGGFYDRLFQGKPLAEAFAEAVRSMTGEHPNKWAPFQLYGPP